MTTWRGRRSAAAAAEREDKRARYPSVVAGRGLGNRFVARPLQGGCVGGRDGSGRGGSVR